MIIPEIPEIPEICAQRGRYVGRQVTPFARRSLESLEFSKFLLWYFAIGNSISGIFGMFEVFAYGA